MDNKPIKIKVGDEYCYYTVTDALEEMNRMANVGIEADLVTYSHGFIKATLTITKINNKGE